MASENKTPKLGLSQFALADKLKMDDYNTDMLSIDAKVLSKEEYDPNGEVAGQGGIVAKAQQIVDETVNARVQEALNNQFTLEWQDAEVFHANSYLKCAKDVYGYVHLKGKIVNGSTLITPGTVIFQLPEGFYNDNAHVVSVAMTVSSGGVTNTDSHAIVIGTDGRGNFGNSYNITGFKGGAIYLDGVTFYLGDEDK